MAAITDVYKHCDTDDTFITLHDCYADSIYIDKGVISFYFKNGFWVTSGHEYNNFSETVRTDASKVDFCLEQENREELTVYIFKKNFFGSTVRKEWSFGKLADLVNNRGFSLEFLYQYKSFNAQIIDCWLHFDKRPYSYECQLKIPANNAVYFWNDLCENKTW